MQVYWFMAFHDIFDTSALMSHVFWTTNYLLIHKGLVRFYKCNIIYRAVSHGEFYKKTHILQVVNEDVLHQVKTHLITALPNGERLLICQQNGQIFDSLFNTEGQNLRRFWSF